ncbi:hypothetical protein WH95_04560 [Kiloniella litopenaei]|uniref:DUF4159 domain-containing protein n=1 Tax=Kiloniella litopenaei TaxID=1549748 RepID=A0A0M2RCK4_9PROT|nr:DUF4159 domain-containing protein [Kiloniella litopenaei]KKJ77725.1 hypothetical protein WH95_04560 [Kiloniella litopenaei]
MLDLGIIGFLNPWLLLGLMTLPVVWLILRITPPAPKKITFPALRLLFGLQGSSSKPQKTAWWLILLRILILLLLILALSEPVYAPIKRADNDYNTLVLVDNDWASTNSWPQQLGTLRSMLEQNKSSNKQFAFLATAKNETEHYNFSGFKSPENLLADIEQLSTIQSWSSNPQDALKGIEKQLEPYQPLKILWLSNGITSTSQADETPELEIPFAISEIYLPPDDNLPLWITAVKPEQNGVTVTIERAFEQLETEERIAALSDKNEILASEKVTFNSGTKTVSTTLKMPNELYNKAKKVTVVGKSTAATTFLLDQSNYRFPVGILTAAGQQDNKSLLGEHYYLQRALGLFTDVRYGSIKELLSRELSTIIVTDKETIPVNDQETLSQWIDQGGLLLRFSGPNLAEKRDQFIPVPLRSGYRNLEGNLTWEQPLTLEDFDKNSPFFGLPQNPEITVSGQLLAQPTPELDSHTWARLQDGTPLITATNQGDGTIVLVHTSSNTRWSNLALSGSFVDILRRILQFGQGVGVTNATESKLPIHDVLDAYGNLIPVENSAITLDTVPKKPLQAQSIGPQNPPGYYGKNKRQKAINLAGNLPNVQKNYFRADNRHVYDSKRESPLQIPLFFMALVLFLLDQALTLWLRGLFPIAAIGKPIAVIALLLIPVALIPSHRATAQDINEPLDKKGIEATLNTYLAYIITGDNKVDADSHSGLAGLSLQLHRRTAVENVRVTGVDLDRDQISPYPFLYWPITAIQEPLTSRGKRQLNEYISNGGLILFDLREASSTLNSALGSQGNAQYLQMLTNEINIPQMEPVPAGHVITRSFYLLESFPGRNNNRDFWTESTDPYRNDGVARILIGSNDWSRAWAINGQGAPLYAMVRGGERQRELAYRFGINLVMYALTGNYKEDQVHIPHILERLGQ